MSTQRNAMRPAVLGLLLLFCAVTLRAQVYPVGPAQAYPTIGSVPWQNLVPGDTVLIYYQPQPYLEKFVINCRGTASAPITIAGVPDSTGRLPVISGNGAVAVPLQSYKNEDRCVVKIGVSVFPPDGMPAYIVLQNLEINGARPPYTYTGQDGTAQTYVTDASAIYIEEGQNITLRNCTFDDCANGLFCAWQTTNLVVENCSFHDNGLEGSVYQHNNYTEADGILFQYNYFGPLRAGCMGNNLKDRSAGTVIRYNWIEDGNRNLDLVDSEYPSINTDPAYLQTFVYGNVIIKTPNQTNGQICHYGGDSGVYSWYRNGTLYFYNNTVISTRTDHTTLFCLDTNSQSVDLRNNIVYTTNTGNNLSMLDYSGYLSMRNNWLINGWVGGFAGLEGGITDGGANLNGADPGFVNFAGQDYHLAAASPCIDAGTTQAAAALPANDVLMEYLPSQSAEDRPLFPPIDLGAYEYVPTSVNQAPVVILPASMTVTLPATLNLNAAVSDDGLPNPPGAVIRAWAVVSGPGPVEFADPAAAVTTAAFSVPGSYVLSLSAFDGALTTVAYVNVTVQPAAPVLSAIFISPLVATITLGSAQAFTAEALDQYGAVMSVPITWSVSAGGNISSAGVFQSAMIGGPFTVTAGSGTVGSSVGLTVAPVQNSVPLPWQQIDIGNQLTGFGTGTGAAFTGSGAGADIWNTSDDFHYVYQMISGDGSIVARVVDQQNTNAFAKAGVLIRESLDGGACYADMVVTPGSGSLFERRLSTGAGAVSNSGPWVAAPYWMKLTRAGNLLSGYVSSDGQNWTLAGSDTVAMAVDVYIGLAVTSHNPALRSTVDFDNVNIASSAPAPVLTAITLNPAQATVTAGGTQQFAALAQDQYGNTMVPPLAWSVSGGGSIDGAGLFSAGTAGGPFTVTAASGTVLGQAAVTVSPAPPVLSNIAVSPGDVTMIVGGTQQFSAVACDQYGNTMSVPFTWTVSGGGAISSTGLFTATAAGPQFTVTAASGNVSGTASLTINATAPAPPALMSIALGPLNAATVVGSTLQFTALTLDQYSHSISVALTWSVSGGGTIDGTGLFSATTAGGPFTVTVASGTVSAQLYVTVAPAQNSVPAPWQEADVGTPLPGYGTGTQSAFTISGSGADIYNSSDGFHYVYQALNGDGAIVARVIFQQNTSTFAKAGVMLRASLDASAPYADMLLTPGGGSLFERRYTAGTNPVSNSGPWAGAPYWVKLTRAGNVFTGYVSCDGNVWTLAGSDTLSLASALYVGLPVCSHNPAVLCTATFDNVSVTGGSAPPVLSSITVTPASATVTLGNSQQFFAVAKDQSGNPMTVPLTWTVSGGGSISSTGLFTATVAGGPFTVTAASGNVSGTAAVTVVAPPPVLTTITVTPASATVAVGASQQFAAVAKDQSDNPMTAPITWTASGGGSISSTGLFIAATAGGPFTVTAASGNVSGTAAVTVVAPPPVLTTITVTPASATVAVGNSQQFSAVAKDQSGNTMTVPITWTVSGGGTVSSAGLFTAATAGGPFTVTAASGNISGRAAVTVSAPAPVLTTITVTPAGATVTVGRSQQFSAAAKDQYGNTIAAKITWTVSGGGRISSTGLFTAAAAGGPFTVKAASGALSGTAAVTVNAAPVLTTIIVTPAGATVTVGRSQQFSATAKDQYGNTIVAKITWTVSGGGTISSKGLFSARTAGGPFTVKAASGAAHGSAEVTVMAKVAARLTAPLRGNALY